MTFFDIHVVCVVSYEHQRERNIGSSLGQVNWLLNPIVPQTKMPGTRVKDLITAVPLT